MEGEIESFTKVWLSVLLSLCYCYTVGKIVPKGTKRLFCVFPIVCLFLFIPLNLFSPHLGGVTYFFVAWLANFKLLLFAFGKGPLSSSSLASLPLFVAVACLPIKIQHNPPPKSHLNGQNKVSPSPKSLKTGRNTENQSRKSPKEGPLNYAIKGILLAIMVRVYDYSEYMHPKIILILYAFHIYFLLELILVISAAIARTVLGLELEPQFDEPYLATSLQDFWGKRWNLMVTGILRPTVYEPTLQICSNLIGRKWAPLPAVFSTFVVSAIMHELMFYYLGRLSPTWEVTWFFLIHGFCLTVEIALKKALNGRWRLPWLASGPLTVGFVMLTGSWLFFPQFTRCKVDVRAFEEYAALAAFVKHIGRDITRIFVS